MSCEQLQRTEKPPIVPNSVQKEFLLKGNDSGASHHLKVHAFLMLEAHETKN